MSSSRHTYRFCWPVLKSVFFRLSQLIDNPHHEAVPAIWLLFVDQISNALEDGPQVMNGKYTYRRLSVLNSWTTCRVLEHQEKFLGHIASFSNHLRADVRRGPVLMNDFFFNL